MNGQIKRNDIITLDDGDKYIVSNILSLDNKDYAYLININNKNDDGFVVIKDNTFKLIEDKQIILKLMELFMTIK